MRQRKPLDALELLRSSSLPGVLQARIEELILSGEIGAGARLNESDLAERFGTSRGPIREALRALEECRLVRAEKNRGVFVRDISVEEADEIYDIREVLDELIGQRVAQRVTPEHLAALQDTLAEMREASTSDDVRHYHAVNLRFHDQLVDLAGNARLGEIYRLLTKELLLFRLRGLQMGGGFSVSLAEHEAVIAAIAARDPDLAGRLLRQHAADSRARMHRATEGGAGAPAASVR